MEYKAIYENGMNHLEAVNIKTKKAVGYIRVSTKQQAGEDRCGRDVQKEAIENYAAQHGYEITKWYEDQMSGAKDHRPAMDKILYGDGEDAVKNPPYEAVIAFKTDRISRDTKMYFYYLYTLEKKGVQLISTQERFENDEFGLASVYRSLIMFVAEQERKNIALRTGKGRYVKAQAGGHAAGVAPYGYKAENKQLVVEPSEAALVRLVYSLRDEQDMSYSEIVKYLIDHGYKTRKGAVPSTSMVQNIFRHEQFYHGWYKFGEMTEPVAGIHEAILEDERNQMYYED